MDSKRNAFSLMEMMVVMLVVAIVMALSAPMITKKTTGSGVNSCLWTALTGGNIGFNARQDAVSAIIGGNVDEIASVSDALGGSVPKLTIATNGTHPQIGFMHSDVAVGFLNMIKDQGLVIGNSSTADKSNSIALGNNANAINTNTIAIGYGANAKGNYGIAIGHAATGGHTTSEKDIAIGWSANTNNAGHAVAIGENANASGSYGSVSLGCTANTVKSGSAAYPGHVAIGRCANTYGSTGNAIAIGHYVKASAADAIAIGGGNNAGYINSTSATGSASIAIGRNTNAYGTCAISLGRNANASESDTIAIGRNANCAASNSISIGYNANANGAGTSSDDAIAIGNRAKAMHNGTIAIGHNTTADGLGSIAIGSRYYDGTSSTQTYSTNSIGSYSTAIGSMAITNGNNAIAIGRNSRGNGENSIVIGHEAKISPYIGISGTSLTMGYKEGGIAIGNRANAVGAYSIAIGDSASSATSAVTLGQGGNSIAIGRSASASSDSGIAIGNDTSSTSGIAIGNQAYASTGIAIGKAYAGNGIAIGSGANSSISSGYTGTGIAIGSGTSAKYQFSTAIGYGATATASNQIVLGNNKTTVYIPGKLIVGRYSFLGLGLDKGKSSVWLRTADGGNSDKNGWIYDKEGIGHYFNGSSSYTLSEAMSFSDKRMKDIIGENLDAMDKINRITVYDFTFKKDDLKTPHVGVIAQDLQKIFPNAVTKDENGYLQIRHEDMFFAMINALKELDAKIRQIAVQLAENIKIVTSDSAKIRELTIRVNNQDKEIKALKKEVEDLKKIVNKLSH